MSLWTLFGSSDLVVLHIEFCLFFSRLSDQSKLSKLFVKNIKIASFINIY